MSFCVNFYCLKSMTYGAFAVLIVLIRSPGSHVLTVLLGLSRGGKAPAMVGSAYAQIGFYSWKELLRVATERVRCCMNCCKTYGQHVLECFSARRRCPIFERKRGQGDRGINAGGVFAFMPRKPLDAFAVTYASARGRGRQFFPCSRRLASERPPVGPSGTV